jgi:biopolymer transport protein ExbB
MTNKKHAPIHARLGLTLTALLASAMLSAGAAAQDVDPDERARAALESAGEQPLPSTDGEAATPDEQPSDTAESINLLDLLVRGGWLMVPIGIVSIVVVALGIERAIALRRGRVLPEELVAALGRYSANDGTFDPKRVYRLCQEFPSSAANVIRSMLAKLGRPHSEVEHAVHEAAQREAGRLYTNVRTLNLAAGIAPLLGLLGTVWGMIQAFFVTANMPVGANKAEALAEGIYVALVTTFAGLSVAIPAAILSHVFEGRIESLLRRVEELVAAILPQVERYEGTVRLHTEQFASDDAEVLPKRQSAGAVPVSAK